MDEQQLEKIREMTGRMMVARGEKKVETPKQKIHYVEADGKKLPYVMTETSEGVEVAGAAVIGRKHSAGQPRPGEAPVKMMGSSGRQSPEDVVTKREE